MINQKTVNALSAIAILSSFSRHAPAPKARSAPAVPPYSLGLTPAPARAPRFCN